MQRFKEHVPEKDAGGDESMHFDADYMRALEYGLAPTAGEGIGIDRLVMLLTDARVDTRCYIVSAHASGRKSFRVKKKNDFFVFGVKN